MSSNTVHTPPPAPICWGKDRREWGRWRRGKAESERPLSFPLLSELTRHGDLEASFKRESRREIWLWRESQDLSWGKMYNNSWGQGFPLHQPSPLWVQYYTHTCVYIHSEHKAFTISGPLHIQMPGASMEIRNIHLRMSPLLYSACSAYSYSCVYMCLYVCMLISLQMCVYVYACTFCPCCGANLRPFRSWGQCLCISVALLSSTEGLSDWWTDGSLVGMKVVVGTEGWATSREESHMHAPIMPTNTHKVKMRGWGKVCVCKTERKALCLGRAVPNVPWGFGAISCPHKQWDTQTQTHTHSTEYSLCPTTRIRWKKSWHVVRDRERQNKDKQRQKSTTALQRASNGCSRVL